ncbi:hypothetical protein [Spirulina subsalsa]|uniref:hypothetical protein n=1 Tax=Spirulina subsalsa TaxID=54311 RepID=UPI0013E0DD83|nr:hypothetical protein [Spirulina subsalsa]
MVNPYQIIGASLVSIALVSQCSFGGSINLGRLEWGIKLVQGTATPCCQCCDANGKNCRCCLCN